MNQNTKIIFTDLDGTLLNDEKEITPGNQAAIDEALAKGHKVVVTTGRALSSAMLITERAGLMKPGCYVIAFNGGMIYEVSSEKVIYDNALPVDVAKYVFHEALRRGVHVQTYSATDVIAVEETEDLKTYCKIVEMKYEIVPDIDAALEKKPGKVICLNYADKSQLEKFQSEVLSSKSDVIDSFFSNDHLLEIVSKGTSKGNAVRWLCDYLDIPIENSVAAGDAANDIEMIKAAHIGAVMCNAFPGVKEFGNYVTKNDNNHDGFAEIVREWILK